MSVTIKSQTFDGVTAPALPSGFETAETWVTAASNPRSGANCLQSSKTSTPLPVWQSDTNSGVADSDVSCWFRFGSAEASVLSGVFLRSNSSAVWTGKTHYEARLENPSGWRIGLYRRVAGTATLVGSTVSIGTFSTAVYYRVLLTSRDNGANVDLVVKIQRASDSNWLTSVGTWQAGETAAITQTDSSGSQITSAGRAGIVLSQPSTANNVNADDFLFTDESDAAVVTIAVNDSDLFWSPYTWRANGSTDYASANPGAYCKIRFTGTSLKANLNSPAFTGTSLRVRAIVDGKQTYNTAIATGTSQITLASGLADTTHDAVVWYDASDPTQDVWSNAPPTMSLRITSFVVDAMKDTAAVTPLSGRMLVYGDSISYGIYALRTATSPTGNAASLSPFVGLAQSYGCELGILGFGSQGYGKTGSGGATAVWNGSSTGTWDKYYTGLSRLSAGAFSPAPDYVMLYHGTADYTGSSVDANVEAGLEGLLAAVRSAASSTKIFVVIPPGRNKATPITDGFEDYCGGYTTLGTSGQVTVLKGVVDTNCFLLNLGAELQDGLDDSAAGETYPAIDGYHPDGYANGRISAAISAGMRLALSGSATQATVFSGAGMTGMGVF